MRGGLTVSGPAAAGTFEEWRDALPEEASLPVTVNYALDAKYSSKNPDPDVANVSGSAVGNFTFQGIDDQRSRLDAFMVLDLPNNNSKWNLTGSMLFDGFFMRAWGTAGGVKGIDPDKIYAVQFQQGVFESTYASMTRLMPKFLNNLEGYGIAGSAFFRDQGVEPAQLFHPRYFLDLTRTALSCRSLRYADDKIYCKLGLDLRESSPLYDVFQNLFEGPEQAILALWTETTLVDAVFEARSGVLLGVNFSATYPPTAAFTNSPSISLDFTLESTDLEWTVADLDRALAPPDTNLIDLTTVLQLADKFLREQSDRLDAENDPEF
ncbi:MAG: hypothetical protein COA70_08375 [Planctomycetota bacterium]|nr:MAG: hypothetical protein COA70_08375 [Planctomycetota bacterium]